MDSGTERDNKVTSDKKGSPVTGGPEFICIGKIHRAHGIRGDVVFNPMTDFPERIRRGKTIYVGDEHLPLTIAHVSEKPPYLLVGFKEISDETAASQLRNRFAYVKTDELPPLPEGEYYFHQLIGLEAVDQAGSHIGVLADILETGANDVYVIRKDDESEELIPDIPQFILGIDLEEKKITVVLPEWI